MLFGVFLPEKYLVQVDANLVSVHRGGDYILAHGYRVYSEDKVPATTENTRKVEMTGLGHMQVDETWGQLSRVHMTGFVTNDWIQAGSGKDQLMGLDGDDSLEGRKGDDRLFGGRGDDRVVWNEGDGSDLIEGGDDYDTIVVTGTADAQSFTLQADGLRVSVEISGPSPAVLDIGTMENFEISAGGGDDTVTLGPGPTGIWYFNAWGNEGNDTLIGGDGQDVLDGGTGDDVMIGHAGARDIYYVDSRKDVVIEEKNGGFDVVNSSVSFSLGGLYVEDLALRGPALNHDRATGNSLNNSLYGNDGNNVLKGGKGDDYLFGAGGDDVLDGGEGADYMAGGYGNDTYLVDNAADRIGEIVNDSGGTDLVLSSITFALYSSRFYENLTLTGEANIDGTGNQTHNVITGNAGTNTLTGGAARDTFVFNTALGPSNIDTITDFNVADDTIRLDHAIFDAIAGLRPTAGQFAANADGVAADASVRIVYATDTGKLFYDSNGDAAGGAVQFAQLSAGLALTYADFLII